MTDVEWRLVDYHEPVECESDPPSIPFASEEELRRVLFRFADSDRRIMELYPPGTPVTEFFRIGIGRGVAGVALMQRPKPGRVFEPKFLIAQKPMGNEDVEFIMWGQPCALEPCQLHAPSNVIDVVCFYYTHRYLPPGLVWA
jgi:hypothetical protein